MLRLFKQKRTLKWANKIFRHLVTTKSSKETCYSFYFYTLYHIFRYITKYSIGTTVHNLESCLLSKYKILSMGSVPIGDGIIKICSHFSFVTFR